MKGWKNIFYVIRKQKRTEMTIAHKTYFQPITVIRNKEYHYIIKLWIDHLDRKPTGKHWTSIVLQTKWT